MEDRSNIIYYYNTTFCTLYRVDNVVMVTRPTNPIPVPDDDEPIITNVIVSTVKPSTFSIADKLETDEPLSAVHSYFSLRKFTQ